MKNVTQYAHRVIKLATMLHTDLFCNGDLHMIDVIPIPQRLEDRIGKTRHEDILDRFLAQVMIDAIDLLLTEDLVDFLDLTFQQTPDPCRTASR